MSSFSRVFWICTGALVSFIFILFAIHNHREVEVDLFFARYRVEVWGVVAVAWVVGFVVPSFFVLAYRLSALRRERQLRQRIETLRDELNALRNVALHEPLAGEQELLGAPAESGPVERGKRELPVARPERRLK